MKKIFGNVVSDEYFEKFINDESNKNLVVVGDEIIGIQHILTTEEKIEELDNWFKNDYATYEQMFTRRKALGIEDTIVDEFRNKTYHNLIELYEEAEVVAGEIRELREK